MQWFRGVDIANIGKDMGSVIEPIRKVHDQIRTLVGVPVVLCKTVVYLAGEVRRPLAAVQASLVSLSAHVKA